MGEAVRTDAGERLAAELDRAGVLLEQLATTLCLDPVVFARHAGPLQRFDQVTQVIGEIARVLRSHGTWHDAILAVRLDAVQERLGDAV